MIFKCAIIADGANGFSEVLTFFNIILGDIGKENGIKLEQEISKDEKKVTFCECDVTKYEDLKNLFIRATNHFGGAQVMANNVGIGGNENFENTTSKNIDPIMNINLTSVLKSTSLAIQHFNEQKLKNPPVEYDFSIIKLSSYPTISPLYVSPVYSTTKKGVLYLTQTLGYINQKGICVNALALYFSDTDIINRVKYTPFFDGLLKQLSGLVSTDQVVNAIHKLIDNKGCFRDVITITSKEEKLLPRLSEQV